MRLPAATSTRSGWRRACSTSIKTQLLELHPAQRHRGRREQRAIRADLVPGAIAKGRDGVALSADELTALFAETRPEAIEDMRQAADELRAELAGETVTFVVNRNINVSNICTVGCAFCGFGQGKRSPDAYEHAEAEFRGRVREAVDYGATEICMQSGIHPDWGLEDYEHWLRVAKDEAPAASTCTRTRRWRSRTWSTSPACRPPTSSRGCATRGSTRRRAPPPRCSTTASASRISPNKLPVARWVEIIEASHAAGLRSTSTVMFGHIEEPWELAEHMRVVRELQERTGGITEFVPLSFVPVPDAAGPHARGRGDRPRGEPQAHRGLPPRAGPHASRTSRPAG